MRESHTDLLVTNYACSARTITYVVREIIISGWKNFLFFGLNYFSISLFLRTFFSHWKRYSWSYGRGFDIGRYFNVLVSNLISRILGAIARTILILIGILAIAISARISIPLYPVPVTLQISLYFSYQWFMVGAWVVGLYFSI